MLKFLKANWWKVILVIPALLALVSKLGGWIWSKPRRLPAGAMTPDEGEKAHEEIDEKADEKIEQINADVERENTDFKKHFGVGVLLLCFLNACVSSTVPVRPDHKPEIVKPWDALKEGCKAVDSMIVCEPESFFRSAEQTQELWGAARRYQVEAERCQEHFGVDQAVCLGEKQRLQDELDSEEKWKWIVGAVGILLGVVAGSTIRR